MPHQLSFELPKRTALGRDEFYVSPANAVALEFVEGWSNWLTPVAVLIGPEGSGKSHLAHVFAASCKGEVIGPGDIEAPEELARGPLVLDDADRADNEGALFHLFNLMTECFHPFLLTAKTAPARWAISLPDLRSRLSAAPLCQIDQPDDQLLAAVLAKNFADRQLTPQPNTIPFLVDRMERSLGFARKLVAALDDAALEERRNISRHLAATVLDKLAANQA